MEPAARNPRASEAPVSARADEPAADGWVHFESDLKPYQCKMHQLTTGNLMDVLPGFEGANLNVDKLRRLGETAHRMVKSLRTKFRGDLDYTCRLNRFAKKAQASWKGRLQSLFCTVLDVQMGKRFRRHGDPANLDRLQRKWAWSWADRLSGSRGRALGEVDQCFEQLALEASNEQRELQELEKSFDAKPVVQSRHSKRQRREPRTGGDDRGASRQEREVQDSPSAARDTRAPRTPPGPDEAAHNFDIIY